MAGLISIVTRWTKTASAAVFPLSGEGSPIVCGWLRQRRNERRAATERCQGSGDWAVMFAPGIKSLG